METTSCGQQYSRRIVDMKDTYRRMCWKCFTRFRDETIGLRQTFPVMSDIDEDVNFLCCLPVDSFARFTTDDESVITLSLLKSLKQLKRLQQSEFFRRIVCIFITICVDKEIVKNKSQEVYNQRVFSEITPLFDELIRVSEQTYSELLSVYKCAKSLWTSSEVSLIKCRDLRQTVESIETKMLRIEELKKSKQKLFNEMEVKSEESVKPLMTLSTAEDYVVRDQVFEAFVTQECHEIDVEVNAEEEQLWEFARKVTQDSTNLFRELKVALKSKAVEHELREAKALGIELPVNPMNDNINKEEDVVTAAEDPISDDNTSQTLPKQSFYEQNIVSTELSTESDRTLSPHKCRPEGNAFSLSSFESNIASFAAQKAKHFGLSEGTECFGDDSDSDSEG
ncbi:unnamed protein product [Medioppia subpectinata]|uniref:Uncharacterized protein n=1 Tax=Medioppia subpectinata TaxID=1979941 RepID=A0A7R9LGF5_9ACAR|nr:unnamed protein product [Medioppia subpectinata]CAG2118579.1 unnamed protein product [Medioppia subpectinata]